MTGELSTYLSTVVAVANKVLGGDLVGGYLTGSVALGAFEPGRSDVDVALVGRGPLDQITKEQLVANLRHDVLPCPARGLELVVYQAEVAASALVEPGFELELNTGATMPFRATMDPVDRPLADGAFWYVLDRALLHERGVTLLGPPAGQVFAEVPEAQLRGALGQALRWWLAVPPSADAVLNACRALVRVRDGVWLAKGEAGRQVLRDDEDRHVVQQALAARAGGAALDPVRARDFQQQVLVELEG